ncbi:MAG: hypothetical protein DSM106950_14590 [Stigonema ocellatum SAG 48.90 = DSM 106950]|nr:hypothetical protein [Stigonema ocellatum SAG 48.90 = DSM 106950]
MSSDIEDIEQLRAIKDGIKTASNLEELRQIYGEVLLTTITSHLIFSRFRGRFQNLPHHN